jgi:hypothetical protein
MRYLHHSVEEASLRNPLLLHIKHALPLPSFLDKALAHWQYQSPDINAVEAMLLALKIATESYLEGPVAVTDLAVPFPLPESGQQLLSSVSSLAGFENVLGIQIAGQAAARANGIGVCHNHHPVEDHCSSQHTTPQLVLTVDYSRAALTAMLWIEESSIFEYRRIKHDLDIGTDALSRCQQHSQGDEECYKQLAEALRQVIKMPLKETESNVPSVIGVLVLLGERATDERFNEILQQVLWEQAMVMSVKSPEWKESGMINPVFAAARGVGAASWTRQNEPKEL